MNHPFKPSQTSADQCIVCKYPLVTHTNDAECEVCGNKGPVEIRYSNMLMCAACWDKERNIAKSDNGGITTEKSYNLQAQILDEAKRIDTSVEVKEDVFNATTVSISDVEKAINENTEIANKPYALAEFILARLQNVRKVGFELSEQVMDNHTEQRALQTYLNNISNKLRAEEREKIRLKNINYPSQPVKVSKPRAISTSKKPKIDKVLLKHFAKEIGLSEFFLQQICVAKNVTVDQAAKIAKDMIAAAKSAK